MKYRLTFIGFVLGMLVLAGCAAGSADINETDKVNEAKQSEQAENLEQADEVSQATDEIVSTEETDEVEQASQVEEATQVGETDQTDDEVSQAEELVEIDDSNQANEADEVSEATQAEETSEVEASNQTEEVDQAVANEMDMANVISVEATGNPGSYTFSVGIASPDEGCQQYADWWEVLNEDGELIYRRVLLHSHVNEQPFVRSGGPVEIAADQIIWVRAHMNTSGYGVVAFTGSVQSGFQEAELSPEFAIEAANLAPLPDGCAF